jgi:uncharacterized membrane protein YdbT with pleckstrin-like domain
MNFTTVASMPYPKNLLNADESVALDLHPHWWYFAEAVSSLVGAIVFGIVMLVVAPEGGVGDFLKIVTLALIIGTALWSIIRYLKWSTTSFVITSDRIIFRNGIIAKSGIEIPLERVNNVNFKQSIFERMIGAGDLLIESGGETGQSRFTDIRKPESVKNLIHTQMEVNQQRSFTFHPPAGSGQVDVAGQLEKLEGLRDRGSITPEEFESQKRKLLGG